MFWNLQKKKNATELRFKKLFYTELYHINSFFYFSFTYSTLLIIFKKNNEILFEIFLKYA